MSGIIFIIIIIFVVVPLINRLKEKMDASDTKNGKKYGGYSSGNKYGGNNNSNIYNSQNSKKITYDWKPDYDMQSNQDKQVGQNYQSSQGNRGAQSNQSQNAVQMEANARTSSAQAKNISAAPAANTQPAPASNNRQAPVNAATIRSASASANTRPTSAEVNSRFASTPASGVGSASPALKSSEKRTTAASIRKEINRKKESGRIDTDNADGVHVSDTFLEQGMEMPDYNSLEYNAATYDVPESDAFKYADVVVDSEVRIDTVVPGSEDYDRANRQA